MVVIVAVVFGAAAPAAAAAAAAAFAAVPSLPTHHCNARGEPLLHCCLAIGIAPLTSCKRFDCHGLTASSSPSNEAMLH